MKAETSQSRNNAAARQALGALGGKFMKGWGISRADLSPDGLPCIRYGEIYTMYGEVTDKLRSRTAAGALELETGDIIFTTSGETVDEIGKAVAYIGETPALAGGDTLVLKGHGQNSSFLGYALNSYDARRQKARLGQGQSIAHIHSSDLEKIEVWLPPIPEQHKIAEILKTWDEAIEALNALIERIKKRQGSLVPSLAFGQRQLKKIYSSNSMQKCRWFECPENWSIRTIDQIADEISERNADGRIEDVLSCTKYGGFVRSLDYFKKQVFSSDLTGYKKIWRDDFGFPSNHVEEGSIGLQNLFDIGVVSPIYTIFRFNSEIINNDYAFAVLKTSLYQHIFAVSTNASVDRRGSLRWGEFSKIPFPVPPIDEQQEIALVLKTQGAELNALYKKRNILTRQKRGLMQKLLTGEWRVAA